MKVAISGFSGTIGFAVAKTLLRGGHEVVRISREATSDRPKNYVPDPTAESLGAGQLVDIDAVVHLAGEPIGGRWNARRCKEILESRVNATRNLASGLAELGEAGVGPRVFVSASAIGIYGNRGDEVLTERSKLSTGEEFLASVCKQWEHAAQEAADAGVRVVHPRFGLVLAAHAPAVQRMWRITRWHLAGRLGGGNQWWSWVSLYDAVQAIMFAINCDELSGPVNVVSPDPIRQRYFVQLFAAMLLRHAIVPTPAFAVKAMLGQMGQELLLDSTRVVPEKLEELGFTFTHPDLVTALPWVRRDSVRWLLTKNDAAYTERDDDAEPEGGDGAEPDGGDGAEPDGGGDEEVRDDKDDD